MIRVIATGLSIELSQTMESFCIHHVYGKERLLNIASGTSKERFRPHGMWDAVKWDGSEESSQKKPYYTYVLRNPDTNEVLYTGKGKSERCFAHFQDLDTISEEERNKKQAALQELLDKGFAQDQIVRLIAVGLNEEEALAIESFCIKYVYGPNTNAVMGHHPNRFRAKGDWDLRIGFDIPFLACAKGSEARQRELDEWLGQGYLAKLEDVVTPYPNLRFSELFNHGAGAPAISATVYGAGGGSRDGGGVVVCEDEGDREERGTVYVFSFSPITFKISVEIRWNGKKQEKWFRKKFRTANPDLWAGHEVDPDHDLKYLNRREDGTFLPDSWKGKPTTDLATARKRLGWMISLLQTNSLAELSDAIGDEGVSELLYVDVEIRAPLEQARKVRKLRKFANNKVDGEQCRAALARSDGNLEHAKQILLDELGPF